MPNPPFPPRIAAEGYLAHAFRGDGLPYAAHCTITTDPAHPEDALSCTIIDTVLAEDFLQLADGSPLLRIEGHLTAEHGRIVLRAVGIDVLADALAPALTAGPGTLLDSPEFYPDHAGLLSDSTYRLN